MPIRWRIVLTATLLNLLMELSVRGIQGMLTRPVLSGALLLAIGATYWSYFALLEDAIGRYRLSDAQVATAGVFCCLLWQLLGPSIVFLPPLIFGVNLLGLLFVNLVWWAPIQTVLALYIANRMNPRDTWQPLLSRVARGGYAAAFVGVTLLLRAAVPRLPPPRPGQVLVMLLLLGATAWRFTASLRRVRPAAMPLPFQPDRFLDGLSLVMTAYLLCSAVLASTPSLVYVSLVDRTALHINLVVSLGITLTLAFHRWRSKRPIPV